MQIIPIIFVFICFAFAPYSMLIKTVVLAAPPFEAMNYLGYNWALWLIPLLFVKKIRNINEDVAIGEKDFEKMLSIVAFISTAATVLLIKNFPKIFAANIADLRLDAEWSATFYEFIGFQLCSVFPFTFFFWGLSLSIHNVAGWKRNLLLIGSFCEPLHVLFFYGRDGLIQWFLLAVLSLALFSPFFKVKINKRKLICLFVFWGVILALFFWIISVSRMKTRTTAEDVNSNAFWLLTVDYCIQIPKNFVAVYDVNNFFSYRPIAHVFPFIKRFSLPYDPIEASYLSEEYRSYFFVQYGYDKNVFSSFIGSLCGLFGKTTCSIISISACVFFSFLFSVSRKTIGYYYLVYFYCFSLLLNFFYLKYSMGIQPWIMVSISFAFFIYYNSKKDVSPQIKPLEPSK